ncbi:MAG: hypothetical protein ACOYXY_04200 [Thermodesulfobacteriota bacterium]
MPISPFDYQAAFGDNPWVRPTEQISNLVAKYASSLEPRSAQSSAGSTSLSSWESSAVDPDDLAVGRYMSHLMGGQRQQLNEYVRRAAGAGIQRSGLNVRGGPGLGSSLHHAAMQTLAAGYGDRFRQAMDYGKYVKGASYSQYREGLADLQNLLGTQHRYLSSQTDWNDRLATLKHGDWQRESEWERESPFRQLKLQQGQQQLRMSQWKDMTEREAHLRSLEEKNQLQRDWQRTVGLSAASVALPSAAGNLLRAERAMVGLGVWQPLSRSLRLQASLGSGKGSGG